MCAKGISGNMGLILETRRFFAVKQQGCLSPSVPPFSPSDTQRLHDRELEVYSDWSVLLVITGHEMIQYINIARCSNVRNLTTEDSSGSGSASPLAIMAKLYLTAE